MTAPVQMTHSSTSAMVEPRGLRRAADFTSDPSTSVPASKTPSAKSHSSKARSTKQSEDVSDSDETPSSDDSASSLEADGSGHSSFGAILRKYVATPGGGSRASQSNQADVSQQKKDSVAPDPLSTVPDQPMGKHREVLPLRLSILSPDTPDQDSTNAPATQTHTGPTNAGSVHAALELALSQLTLTQAHMNPDMRSGDNTGAIQSQPEQSQEKASQTVTLQTEPTPAQASPGPAAPAPESTAFAVKLTPSTPAPADETNTKAAELSTRPQTYSQFSQKELPAADAPVSTAQPADSSADRLAMINTMPHLAQASTQNETVASAPKNETRPLPTPSALRAEPVNPPAAQTGSSRDFTVRIPDATERGTNVRFVERGSEVHVSVRTSDAELAQLLRGGLGDLTGRLQHNGVQAEVWRPGSEASHSDSQSQSSESKDQGGRRHQSGAHSDGQDQPREDKPRWVEELESFGEPVAVKTY